MKNNFWKSKNSYLRKVMECCHSTWLRMKNVYIDVILITVNWGFINETLLGRWETQNVHMRGRYYSATFGNQYNVYNTEAERQDRPKLFS